MKICPRCEQAFEDSLEYCVNDGEPLVAEHFMLPSEAEEATVIRSQPVVVEIPTYDAPPATEASTPVFPIIVERPRNTWKYLMFLGLGIVIGGLLVLAAAALGIYFYKQRAEVASAPGKPSTPVSSPTAKQPTPTPAPTPSSQHAAKTDRGDDEFNGRVIADDAVLRFVPSKNGAETDRLPRGDRIDIEERAGENSPWYRVTCEHGATGWMHGNDIEYTD